MLSEPHFSWKAYLLKKLLLLPALLFGLGLTAQKTVTIEYSDSAEAPLPPIPFELAMGCQQGLAEAKEDVANGRLGQKHYGYPVRVAHSYEHVSITDVLEERYQVHYEHLGCEHWPAYDCYNSYMDSVIMARFGKDVFERAEASADSINKSRMTVSGPAYPGGSVEMRLRLEQDAELLRTFRKLSFMEARVNLWVDATGKPNVEAIEFTDLKMKSNGASSSTEERISHLLREQTGTMPRWEPARDGHGTAIDHRTCFVVRVRKGEIESVSVCIVMPDF